MVFAPSHAPPPSHGPTQLYEPGGPSQLYEAGGQGQYHHAQPVRDELMPDEREGTAFYNSGHYRQCLYTPAPPRVPSYREPHHRYLTPLKLLSVRPLVPQSQLWARRALALRKS